ncbi:MAG: hypothetical protein ACLSHO_06190 [Dysosmobacter sp.]
MEFENKNASGEANNCGTIVNGFVSEGVDLIMANATAAPDRRRFRDCRHSHSGHLHHRLRRGPGS